MKNDISEEELRKAITEALTSPIPNPGFKDGETTAPAVAKKHNISRRMARQLLGDLCERGVMERAKVDYVDNWGDKLRVKGYKVKEK